MLTENDTIPINIQYDAAGNLMWWEKLYVDEIPLFLGYKSVSITPYQVTCIEDIDIYFRKKLIGNSYGINIGIECLTTPYLYIYNKYWQYTLSNGTMLLISRNTAKETLVSIACPYKAIPSAADLKDSGDFKEITKGIIAYKKTSPSPSLPLLRWSLREQMYKFSIPAGSKHTLRVDTIGADVKKIVRAPDSVSINLLGYRYSEQAVLDSLVFENNYPENNDFYVKLYQHRDSIQRDSSTWYRPFDKSYTLENLPDGVYTIHLLNNDEEIKTSVFTVSEQPLVPQVSTYNYAENPEPNLYQYCKEFMPDTLYAQGTNIKWYEMLADSIYALLAEGNTYFPTSNDQVIYVSQTTALGYESEKLAITLEPLPPPNLGGGYFNLYEQPGSCDVTFGYNCLYCVAYCVDDEFPFVLQVGLQSINFYKDGVPISAPYVGNQYDYNYACLCLGHCNYYATKGNGVYTIEFYLKNEYGCENVIAHDFNVITYPDIDKKVTVCTDDPAIELAGENLLWYDNSGATLLGQGNTFEIYSPGFYQVSQTVNGVEGPKCKFEATLQSPNYDPFNPNDCYKQQLADIAAGGTSSIGNISIDDVAVTFPPTAPNYTDMTKEDGGGKQGSLAFVPTSRRFSIAPNPVEDVAILRLPADMEVELRLWSAAGKLLWEQQKAADGERITMADLAAGVYYVELRSASGVYSMKLVKIDK
ncbi:MAG: T9SS type A sorting domain-containing protein [Sphingobacteriales bacterium]|nr:T9SS type A sorting domain-containing protein [Sphingobacteriales bacterium]